MRNYNVKKLWYFPVPSTAIESTKLIYPQFNNWLLFDYHVKNESGKYEIFNSGIMFNAVQAMRHSCEKFTESLMGAYDCLVEVEDSQWVKQLQKIDRQIADFWDIKHFAIFLDSNGLFEFIARGYEILDVKKGALK